VCAYLCVCETERECYSKNGPVLLFSPSNLLKCVINVSLIEDMSVLVHMCINCMLRFICIFQSPKPNDLCLNVHTVSDITQGF